MTKKMKRKASRSTRARRRGARSAPAPTRARVRGATTPSARVRGLAPAAGTNQQADQVREQALAAIKTAKSGFLEQMRNSDDPAKLRKLSDAVEELAQKNNELIAIELRELLDSAAVRNALARLQGTTAKLESTAQEIKQATAVIQKATQILGFVDQIVETLAGLGK